LADLVLARDDKHALRATVDFLVSELRLQDGNRVYDQCCGIGGLSIPLAARGLHVTGIDLCDFFIDRASATHWLSSTASQKTEGSSSELPSVAIRIVKRLDFVVVVIQQVQ
jgi:2-polyprenyl-3-methyl-5-hydroxy-6-metoxy-1,4-benzoquinol methylase